CRVGDRRGGGPGAGGFDLEAAAVGGGRVARQGAAQDRQRAAVGEHTAAVGRRRVALDFGVGDRRRGTAHSNAAAVAAGTGAQEEAVLHDQRTQSVLVAEATAGRTGVVVRNGAARDGDGAGAGVADAAAEPLEGRVVADDGARDGQVGGNG